jgi:phage/plasmid-like protein (TIGR03299 family)
MSRETMTTLNTDVLIGMTDERGHAWHYRAEEQGAESNHYPRAIPVADVQRRLFHWSAEPRRVAVEVPADLTSMTHLSPEGLPMRWDVQVDRQAIARDDNDHVMGIFKDGYRAHQYNEWLIGTVSNILGDTLVISSAGLLKQGALAWVEVSMPETRHIESVGASFRPNILSGTSFDGSVATFSKRTNTMTVCDNTFEVARAELGQIIKWKHTRNSGFKLGEARAALNIIHEEADAFEAEVTALAQTTVTDRQWFSFLDEFSPLVDAKGEKLTGRSLTMAANKQDQLKRLWVRDNRVEPWKNTAFGVLQAVNTWGHHEQTVRGATRPERNMLNAITGAQAKVDNEALTTLGKILSNA